MQFSTDYHLQNYRELDTDELLRRVMVLQLTDEALAAVRIVLAERGVDGDRLDLAVVEARRSILQSSSATNECDWCGGYTMLGKHWQGGQKFCSDKCARLSRLNAAALTLAPDVVLEHAHHLSAGACPMCKRVGELVEIRSRHTIVSFLLFASVHVEPRMSCRTCAVKEAWMSIAICALFGWWSLTGLFRTPAHIWANLRIVRGDQFESQPTRALIQHAALDLAERVEFMESSVDRSGKPAARV